MDDGIVRFLRRPSNEQEGEAVDLKIGTDWSQPAVARTRNMSIACIYLSWCHVSFTAYRPLAGRFQQAHACRAVELCLKLNCPRNSVANLQHLFQPFFSSKLGAVRYELTLADRASNEEEKVEFEALWSAWDSPTAQFAAFYVDGDSWRFLTTPFP